MMPLSTDEGEFLVECSCHFEAFEEKKDAE